MTTVPCPCPHRGPRFTFVRATRAGTPVERLEFLAPDETTAWATLRTHRPTWDLDYVRLARRTWEQAA